MINTHFPEGGCPNCGYCPTCGRSNPQVTTGTFGITVPENPTVRYTGYNTNPSFSITWTHYEPEKPDDKQ